MFNTPTSDRATLLAQLASITSMQRGTLKEEFRPAAKGSKQSIPLGPYFKHQCWEDGRNLSTRVPVTQVPLLQEDLRNGQQFDLITAQLAQLNINEARARLAAQADATNPQADSTESKKNSTQRASTTSKAKPRASSPKPVRSSRKRG